MTAPFAHGYEFLPHGLTFEDAVRVTLPYQPSLLPDGYVPEDVETFYYDTDLQRWEPLARADVDRDAQTVRSLTDHFTVMINAVVVKPEHPQVASFDPNRIQGIEAADPSARIVTIAPPAANHRGDAQLRYPFDLPPGRLGAQPSLALVYSSSGGNGWVGVGWDVRASAIEVDTRFGVPRYDGTYETETYALDGQQLGPVAHLDELRLRSDGTTRIGSEDVKIFRRRIEGSFQRIIRHGATPAEYWWEVIHTDGSRLYYGRIPGDDDDDDDAVVLATDAGNVFRWPLREMRDTHGNRVVYDYQERIQEAPETPGKELYLARVSYTLREGDAEGPYQILFLREWPCASDDESGCRPDVIISGRGGFKQVTAERLRRVEVRYRSTVVRAWELGYETGPFGKSRLVSLTQFGLDNLPFPGNVHRFDYYDDVGTGSVLQGFGTGAAVSSIDGDPSAGVDIPSALDAVGVAEASVLGGSHSISMGTHFYAGFNPTQPTKQGSYGIKIGGNFSQTDGFVGFFDIDGDGLSDRVFQEGDRWYYNRSSLESDGSVTFADAAAIGDFPGLSRERAFTISVGPEAYPLAFQFHSNVALTLTQADTYLSDVNGDGFVDVVQGGNVYFNRPEGDRGFEFAFNDPSDTPIELRPSVVDGAPLRGDYSDLADAFEQAAPPIDIVRRFRAPYSGRVRITGPVGLRRAQPEGADGVRVSIEHEGTSLWTDDIVPTDTSERSPVLELDVVARDRIHFRVHSRSDGREDAVDWHPVIEYVDRPAGVVDENELPVHRFDALDDFTIAGRTGAGIKLPFTGVLRVTGTLRKLRQTTDDVVCRVAVNGTVVFERALAWDEVTDIVLDQDIAVAQEDFVTLFIDSDSPIDLSALTFEPPPTIEYLSAETVDESGETVPVEVIGPSGEPLFLHPLPYDIQTFSFQLPEAPPTPFVPSSDRTLVVTATAASMTAIAGGTVTFTAKREGRLVAKRLIHVPAGDAASVTVDVPVRRGRPVFFAFSADDPSLFAALMTAATYALPGGGLAALPTIQYGPDVPTRLTRGYRGWSFVGYNGGDGRGDAPIDPDVLEAPPSFDGDDEASDDWSEAQEQARRFGEQEQLVFALYPVPSNPDCVYDRFETDRVEQDVGILCSDAAGAHLKGPDEFVYVAGTTMSASRLGPDQVDVPSSGRLAGGRAVPRITLSHQIATGLGLGPLSASFVVDGRGSSKLDFLDMNGDGFPDVVGGEATQYTDPTGTLRWTDSLPARPVRETGSQSITLGIGGNIASAQINGRGHAGTGPDGRAGSGSAASTQMATLGVGLSATAGAGVATTLYDLLDVNGDGLPDRVRQSDTGLRVSLNLGYEFAAEETWGAGFAHRSNSRELTGGASLSFGDGVYGFGGGVSATHSTTRVEPMDDLPSELLGAGRETLIDVNGDGLLDLVQPGDSALRVWFNRGHGFAPTPWSGRERCPRTSTRRLPRPCRAVATSPSALAPSAWARATSSSTRAPTPARPSRARRPNYETSTVMEIPTTSSPPRPALSRTCRTGPIAPTCYVRWSDRSVGSSGSATSGPATPGSCPTTAGS